MSVLDEIKRMREEGKEENEIVASLTGRGVSQNEIENAMSQVEIKDAVSFEDNSNDDSGVPVPSTLSPSNEYSPESQSYPPYSDYQNEQSYSQEQPSSQQYPQ